MSNTFNTQEEFFRKHGESMIPGGHYEQGRPVRKVVTVEEMYQHFRARMIDELEVVGVGLPYPANIRQLAEKRDVEVSRLPKGFDEKLQDAGKRLNNKPIRPWRAAENEEKS